jgi:competence protein ComEC
MKWRILLLSAILALGWWGWGLRGGDEVVVCDVGQGSGAIIISGRTQMLVDTGPENGKMLDCLEKYMPAGDKKIEAVVISHWDTDHGGGLEKIKKYYTVEQIYSSAELGKNDILRFGKYVIEVVWPEIISGDDNADSVVLRVDHEGKIFWFLGDITADVEQYLSWRNLWSFDIAQDKGGVLVASHHGSKSATTKEMLEAIKPAEVIISVGKNNRYGHPSQEVIDRLNGLGISYRRTDEKGDIIYAWQK